MRVYRRLSECCRNAGSRALPGPAITPSDRCHRACGPQHQISRVLKGCDITAHDERTGRAAGIACAASRTTDVVDAIVIATAARHRAPVVTSDPGDLARIADAIGITIKLYPT